MWGRHEKLCRKHIGVFRHNKKRTVRECERLRGVECLQQSYTRLLLMTRQSGCEAIHIFSLTYLLSLQSQEVFVS